MVNLRRNNFPYVRAIILYLPSVHHKWIELMARHCEIYGCKYDSGSWRKRPISFQDAFISRNYLFSSRPSANQKANPSTTDIVRGSFNRMIIVWDQTFHILKVYSLFAPISYKLEQLVSFCSILCDFRFDSFVHTIRLFHSQYEIWRVSNHD